MIRIIKITTFAIFVQLLCMTSFAQNADMSSGYVYVHTSRNAPVLIAEKSKGTLKSDVLMKAENIEINCEKNQIAFLILSNRTVLQLGENTKIRIKSFMQTPPFSFDFYDESEKTRSLLEMEVISGQIRVYGTRPRATSSINITTHFGKFDLKSTMFSMLLTDKNAQITIFEGQATFTSKNGKTDFIQNKQQGEISADKINSRYPMKIDYLTSIEEDALLNGYDNCKTVFKSVAFYKTKDGKFCAKRITPKEFLNRTAKYEYRK